MLCAVGIVIRVVLNAVAVWIATLIVPGVDVTTDSTGKKILTLVVVGAILGLINATIKPIAQLLSLPLYPGLSDSDVDRVCEALAGLAARTA